LNDVYSPAKYNAEAVQESLISYTKKQKAGFYRSIMEVWGVGNREEQKVVSTSITENPSITYTLNMIFPLHPERKKKC